MTKSSEVTSTVRTVMSARPTLTLQMQSQSPQARHQVLAQRLAFQPLAQRLAFQPLALRLRLLSVDLAALAAAGLAEEAVPVSGSPPQSAESAAEVSAAVALAAWAASPASDLEELAVWVASRSPAVGHCHLGLGSKADRLPDTVLCLGLQGLLAHDLTAPLAEMRWDPLWGSKHREVDDRRPICESPPHDLPPAFVGVRARPGAC